MSFLFVSFVGRRALFAQDESIGTISVREGGAPKQGIRITLRIRGALVDVGETDATGTLHYSGHFDQCIAGDPTHPLASAYPAKRKCVLEIDLRTIAITKPVESNEQTFSNESPETIASGNISAAVGTELGVHNSAEGGSGKVKINGIPFSLPPLAGGAASIVPADLLDSVTFENDDDGELIPDYRLPAPTKTPTERFRLGGGDDNDANAKAVYTSAFGKLGVATVASLRHSDGVLADVAATDTSGVDYDHSTHAFSLAHAGTVSYNAGKVQLFATEIHQGSNSRKIDTTLSGDQLLGEGPDVPILSRTDTDFGRASYVSGSSTTSLVIVKYGGSYNADGAQRLQFGIISPLSSQSEYRGHYIDLGFQTQQGLLKLGLDLVSNRTAFSGSNGESTYGDSIGDFSTTLRISDGDEKGLKIESAFVDSNRFGSIQSNGLEASVTLQHERAGNDLELTAASNLSSVYTEEVAYAQVPEDPTQLTFDCANESVEGPTSSLVDGRPARTNSLKATASRTVGVFTARAGAYLADTINNYAQQYITSPISGFDDAYLNLVDQTFAARCQNISKDPTVYADRYVNLSTQSREWYAEGVLKLRGFSVRGNYETFLYTAQENQNGLMKTLQLPNAPLHRGTLVLGKQLGKATFAVLAQYQSANNGSNLPAYISADLGCRLALRHGSLTFSATNIVGAYNYRYGSPSFAFAQPATSGQAPVMATPLYPSWRIMYDLRT